MTLRVRKYLEEMSAEELYSTGHWVTVKGKPLFIGGADPKKRPKKTRKPADEEAAKKWAQERAQLKFSITAAMASNVGRMDKVLSYEAGGDKLDEKKAAATALKIILETGMRVGGGKGRKGSTKGEDTFGTTSLERRHVKISGNKVELSYRGKSGVEHRHEVNDETVARSVREFMGGKDDAPDDSTPLFTFKGKKGDVVLGRKHVSKRLKKFDVDYKPKDLRTLKANEVASEEIMNLLNTPTPPLETDKDKEKFVRKIVAQVSKRVAESLGNTPSVARNSYINPALLETGLKGMGIS